MCDNYRSNHTPVSGEAVDDTRGAELLLGLNLGFGLGLGLGLGFFFFF